MIMLLLNKEGKKIGEIDQAIYEDGHPYRKEAMAIYSSGVLLYDGKHYAYQQSRAIAGSLAVYQECTITPVDPQYIIRRTST